MKKIKLTQGKYAIVDDDDFERLIKYKWYAAKHRQTYYAFWRDYSVGNGITIRMHRFIMDAKRGEMIDHKNRNGLDNRKSNLRFSNPFQNARNAKHPNNRSKYKGVAPVKWKNKNGEQLKWTARIWLNNRTTSLGCFKTELEAAAKYDEVAFKFWGDDAFLNLQKG